MADVGGGPPVIRDNEVQQHCHWRKNGLCQYLNKSKSIAPYTAPQAASYCYSYTRWGLVVRSVGVGAERGKYTAGLFCLLSWASQFPCAAASQKARDLTASRLAQRPGKESLEIGNSSVNSQF